MDAAPQEIVELRPYRGRRGVKRDGMRLAEALRAWTLTIEPLCSVSQGLQLCVVVTMSLSSVHLLPSEASLTVRAHTLGFVHPQCTHGIHSVLSSL